MRYHMSIIAFSFFLGAEFVSLVSAQLRPETAEKPDKPAAPKSARPSPPKPGDVKENPKDGLKYVWIPPGTFMMGCSSGDTECLGDERPSHQVTLTKGFWMGQTAVTAGSYLRFAVGSGRPVPPPADLMTGWANVNVPISNVTWDDAQAFCHAGGGRLPTEAEWEYAARAGSSEPRYGALNEIAWYADNSGRQPLDSVKILKEDKDNFVKRAIENGNSAHDVARKNANAFGLYDMLGNVSEWVGDWYDQNYYQNSPAQDPSGSASGMFRAMRGGYWMDPPGAIRVSHRTYLMPGIQFNYLGFRCVGELSSHP